MARKAILITGAAGEVGLSLIDQFARDGEFRIVALDLHAMDHPVPHGADVAFIQGDVTDGAAIRDIFREYDVRKVFHLAALLSSTSERNPALAHHVNVNGSLNVLQAAQDHSEHIGKGVRFVFPSSIAVYGINSLEARAAAGAVSEDEFLSPVTMYGTNKLYVEHLGRYFARHYKILEAANAGTLVDFRAVRLPGLLSCDTVPAGGTSDYASQMIHACARKEPYASFASTDVKIPFMAMPDAISALRKLSLAPRETLTRTAYNITGFSVSAEEIRCQLLEDFPRASITYAPDPQREAILRSWPEALDDSCARADWGWSPQYSFISTFRDYLIPGILQKYC